MKRDKLVVGSYYHIIERGARFMDIFHDDNDRWNCLRLLFYLNDSYYNNLWERELADSKCPLFKRPKSWPTRDPLVSLEAFCLHDNHFHLLVREIKNRGISDFMHRLPNSMSLRYNKKYNSSGTIFQGPYKLRLIDNDADLENVALYIMVKNVFERFPGGIKSAENNFKKAWLWGLKDNFSSFADYASKRNSPIVNRKHLRDFFDSPVKFKKSAYDYLKYRRERENEVEELLE